MDELINGHVFYKQDGTTPLMTASFEGHADIVQSLIEAKAQVNTQEEVYTYAVPKKTHCTTHHHHTQCHCTQLN